MSTRADRLEPASQPARRGRPPRREGDSSPDTRAALLEATAALMIAKDSIDVSLGEIAAATGQSRALAQYHFGSKRGLLLALVERDAATAISQLSALEAAGLDVVSTLRAHVRGLIDAYYRAPYGNRLLHALMRDPDPSIAQHITATFLRPIADFQADLLARGAAEGVFRKIEPMHFYFIVLGAADHFFARRNTMTHVFGHRDLTREAKSSYADAVDDLIIGGIVIDAA